MAKTLKYDIFLSYNSAQIDWVRDVANQLRALGLEVFFDKDSVGPGAPVIPSLESALKASRRVLLVLSPSSLKSEWVELERTITQHTAPKTVKNKLIPIRLEPIKERGSLPKPARRPPADSGRRSPRTGLPRRDRHSPLQHRDAAAGPDPDVPAIAKRDVRRRTRALSARWCNAAARDRETPARGNAS